MPERTRTTLIGRRSVPDWRMPGRGMLGGAALSAAVHGGIAIAILMALGYPFLSDDVPEPPEVEVILEDAPPEPIEQPPAEPIEQEAASPETKRQPDKAMRRLALNLAGFQDRQAAPANPGPGEGRPAVPSEGSAPARPGAPQQAPTANAPTAAQRVAQPDADSQPRPQAETQPQPTAQPQPRVEPQVQPQALPQAPEPQQPPPPPPEKPSEQGARPAPSDAGPLRSAPPDPAPASLPATEPRPLDQAQPARTRPTPPPRPFPPDPGRAAERQAAPTSPAPVPAPEPPVPAAPPADRLKALAAAKRQAAAQDLAAARSAAARAGQSAQDATDLMQAVAARLQQLLEASTAPWAREQVAAANATASALHETAARNATLAEAGATQAATLAAGLHDDTSPAAAIRRADAIATARSRAEQAADAAQASHARLQQTAAALPDAVPAVPPARPDTVKDTPPSAPAPAARPETGRMAGALPEAAAKPALPADAVPAGRPEMSSADGAAADRPGPGEAALQRGSADANAIAWLGVRMQQLIDRVQGDPAGMKSPDARVAMRALEMRSRNLDAAAATLATAMREAEARLRAARAAGLPPPPPDPQLDKRIETANAAFVATAVSVAEALDPVIARMPPEEAAWAKVMRASFDWLVERRQQDGRPEDEAELPVPEPTPQQRQVLRAAREADPILPAVGRPQPAAAASAVAANPPSPAASPIRSRPAPQDLQAALNAARLHQIARSGTPSALYNLANALLNADGVRRDPVRAAALLRQLAEENYRPAQVRYAEIAMLGDGRPADAAEALAWYRIAAINGSTAGQRAGAALAVELSPEARAEAERIVAHWLKMQGPLTKPGQDELDRSLAKAIQSQNYGEVERLLKQGANPQALDDRGRTALVGAAWRGRSPIVRLLMEHGVLTEVRDAEQRSALLWASINGYPQIADDLLDFGANVDIRDNDGATPLIRAAWNSKYAVVERLLAAGADLGIRDGEGRTAIDRASAEGDSRMVRMLSGKGARP